MDIGSYLGWDRSLGLQEKLYTKVSAGMDVFHRSEIKKDISVFSIFELSTLILKIFILYCVFAVTLLTFG